MTIQPLPDPGAGIHALSRRERFLRACHCQPVDYPPVWMMRQAGRALPEYRKLKEKYTFLELAQTPELAAEVTLQPIRRFGFDAAIIFSDILVVPEAMGVGYSFRETGGVQMDFAIKGKEDIDRLTTTAIDEKLDYVRQALRIVKGEMNGAHALIGFAGSPWTLANYMLDGGSAGVHQRALRLFYENRFLFETLCEKLTAAIIEFLRLQIQAGAEVVQIFDSLGGLIPLPDFRAASAVWMREIIAALALQVPVIVFSKGTRDWVSIQDTGADAVGVDYEVPISAAIGNLARNVAVQGNLDPGALVRETAETVEAMTTGLLAEVNGRNGYIFNLGHGLPPESRLENISAVIQTIRSSK